MPAMALDEFFYYVSWIQGQFLKIRKKGPRTSSFFCPHLPQFWVFLFAA